MRRTIAVLLAALLGACAESSVGIEGACVAAVNVDGVTFTSAALPPLPPDAVGDVHMEVTIHVDCQDQGIADTTPWDSGVSNFLPVGTQLHRVDGFAATVRLTYYEPEVDEWLQLVPFLQQTQS